MKILLTYPPYKAGITAPPLGLAYIAAVLEENGYSPRIIDFAIEPGLYNDLEKTLQSFDIVSISFLTPMVQESLKIAEVAHHQGSTVIVGGPHATALPYEQLENPNIDIVVRGEGEYSFLEVVNALDSNKDLNNIQGISFKKHGQIIDNPPREYIQDLDQLPFPARHLLKIKKYKITYPGFDNTKPVTSMMCSRGCPGRCIHCASNIIFGRKTRYRSPINIADEMEEIANKYQIYQINFSDDAFTLRPSKVVETCNEIIRRDLNIKWACSTRVDTINKEMLTKMKEAGCTRVGFGIESGSSQILKNIKKGITIEQVENALKLIEEVKMEYPVGYFMIGNLGEDHETIKETIDFIHKHKNLLSSTSIVTPYPGTELLKIVKEKNYLNTFNWSEFTTGPPPVIRTDKLNYEEINEAYNLLNSIIMWGHIKRNALFFYFKAMKNPLKAMQIIMQLIKNNLLYCIKQLSKRNY